MIDIVSIQPTAIPYTSLLGKPAFLSERQSALPQGLNQPWSKLVMEIFFPFAKFILSQPSLQPGVVM